MSSSTVDSLLRSLFLEFREAGDYEGDVPAEPLKLRRAFAELLQAVGSRRRTVLVIDALNQLETGLRDLDWLPSRLPRNVKLIVSFKRGEEEAEQLRRLLVRVPDVQRYLADRQAAATRFRGY